MFAKLWKDEAGIVGLEYLLLATIVGLGLVIGFANLEGAINSEYTELSSAILALSQGYEISSQSGCKATKQGTLVVDTAGAATFGFTPPGAVAPNTSALANNLCGTATPVTP
jgi:Flp pilus assembly pilin Flp